jgi:hypothetical protein
MTSHEPRKRALRTSLIAFGVGIAAAVAPVTLAHAATQTIYFEGNISSGTWKSSSHQYYLDGGRAWVIGEFDTPRFRTVLANGTVVFSVQGQFGGAVQATHARALNAKSSCSFLPYSGKPTTTKMICKYIK